MTPRNFTLLAAGAAASLVLASAMYVSSRPWTPSSDAGNTAMLANLRANAAKVGAIEISRGNEKVRLGATNGGWVIESSDSFPADTESVRKLILNASEADLTEKKTAKKDLHKLLGLNEPSDTTSAGYLLRFLDSSGTAIAEIITGNKRQDASRQGNSGTYVRRPGEDQTWLVNREFRATTSFRDWTKTKLIDWPAETIKTANIEVAGESAYAIERDIDGKTHKLSNMPAGKKLKIVNSIDDIVEAISLIEFKNVRRAGTAALPAKAGHVSFEGEKGKKVAVDYFSDGNRAWVTLTPAGDGEGKAWADELEKRISGWEFEVPVTEINATLKKLSELLEDVPS